MQKSAISWTTETWNPVSGCSKVSDGCKFCYAMTLSEKYGWTTKPWTIQHEAENVVLKPHKLHEPYKLKEPARVFVNSMSDLHHRVIPDWYRAAVWCVMLDLDQHIFQVLTKRSESLADWESRFLAAIKSPEFIEFREQVKDKRVKAALFKEWDDPWASHIWQGVSVEDSRVLHRLDDLRACGAKVKFVSAEPLLGSWGSADVTGLDWIIVGGESGQHMKAGSERWMQMAWAREIKRLCIDAKVAYFYKQDSGHTTELRPWLVEEDGSKWRWHQWPGDLTPPVPLDDKGTPLSTRDEELYVAGMSPADCQERISRWEQEVTDYQGMASKASQWTAWLENARLTLAYWQRAMEQSSDTPPTDPDSNPDPDPDPVPTPPTPPTPSNPPAAPAEPANDAQPQQLSFNMGDPVVPNPQFTRRKKIKALLDAEAFGIIQYGMSRRWQILWSNNSVVPMDDDEILPAPDGVRAKLLPVKLGALVQCSTANQAWRGRIVEIKDTGVGTDVCVDRQGTKAWRSARHVIVLERSTQPDNVATPPPAPDAVVIDMHGALGTPDELSAKAGELAVSLGYSFVESIPLPEGTDPLAVVATIHARAGNRPVTFEPHSPGAQDAAPLPPPAPILRKDACDIPVGWFDGEWHIKQTGVESSLCGIDWVGLPTTGPIPDCARCRGIYHLHTLKPGDAVWIEPLTTGGKPLRGTYKGIDPDWPGTAKVSLNAPAGILNVTIAASALNTGEPPTELDDGVVLDGVPSPAIEPPLLLPAIAASAPATSPSPLDDADQLVIVEDKDILHVGTKERGIVRRIDRSKGRVYVQVYGADGKLIDIRDSNDQPVLVEFLLRHVRPAPYTPELWWMDEDWNVFRDDRPAQDAFAVAYGPYTSEAEALEVRSRRWVQAPTVEAAEAKIGEPLAQAVAFARGDELLVRYSTTAYHLHDFSEHSYLQPGLKVTYVRSEKRDLATFGVVSIESGEIVAVSMAVIGPIPHVGTELQFAERDDDDIVVTRYRCDALPTSSKPGGWSFYKDWEKKWEGLGNIDMRSRLDLGLHPNPEYAAPLPTSTPDAVDQWVKQVNAEARRLDQDWDANIARKRAQGVAHFDNPDMGNVLLGKLMEPESDAFVQLASGGTVQTLADLVDKTADKFGGSLPSTEGDKSPVTTVVNFRDVKSHWDAETQTWDDPKYVYIGRANKAYRLPQSKWANPFPAQPRRNPPESKEDANRRVITAFRTDLLKPHSSHLLAQIEELRGKVLVCWCSPDLPCHGEVLVKLLTNGIPAQVEPSKPAPKPTPEPVRPQMQQLSLF